MHRNIWTLNIHQQSGQQVVWVCLTRGLSTFDKICWHNNFGSKPSHKLNLHLVCVLLSQKYLWGNNNDKLMQKHDGYIKSSMSFAYVPSLYYAWKQSQAMLIDELNGKDFFMGMLMLACYSTLSWDRTKSCTQLYTMSF